MNKRKNKSESKNDSRLLGPDTTVDPLVDQEPDLRKFIWSVQRNQHGLAVSGHFHLCTLFVPKLCTNVLPDRHNYNKYDNIYYNSQNV